MFNVTTERARRQTKVSKQTMLLDGVDVGPPKQHVCWRGLNRYVHEAMNNVSNVKFHLKTRSGNVNIDAWLLGRSAMISQCYHVFHILLGDRGTR